MKKQLKKQTGRFGRWVGMNQWLPAKELTVEEYCNQYYATYTAPKTIIYPKQICSELPPQTIEKEISWKFRSLYTRKESEAFVLILNNASVYGSNGAIITQQKVLLRDVSREFGNRNEHSLTGKSFLKTPKHIDGVVAVLATAGANTYYHWLFDILPRFHLIEKAGLLNKIDYFVLPPIKQAFQKETLALLPVDPAKWIEADADALINASTLVVPSLPSALGTISKWASDFVAAEIGAKTTAQAEVRRKIYVSRMSASTRRLINEKEIIELLTDKGFEVIEAEKYSFAEQVSIFKNANVVIAPHGSGLANTVFCREGTIVLDMLSSDFVVPCFWSLANNCGLQYHFLYSGNEDHLFFKPYWEGVTKDFKIQMQKLNDLLTAIGHY